MIDALQQMALVEMLLSHWDDLLMRMGPLSPDVTAQFAALAAKLKSTTDLDGTARIIDDLLDLANETAGADYARELVLRAKVQESNRTRELTLIPGQTSAVPGILRADAQIDLGAINLADGNEVLASVLSRTTAADKGVLSVPVFFATNRGADAGPRGFSGEVSSTLGYGVAQVSIPVANHELGKLERPKWWNLYTREEQKYFLLNEIHTLSATDYETELQKASQASSSQELLIFLHGFNVTFEEAALRAAQFAYDSKFQGLVVLFSWPSLGRFNSYSADEDRAGASGEKLAAFLAGLETGTWKKVHLLAHSMGNRVLLSALADNARAKLPFGQLIFAAADVYVPVFDEKFPKLQQAGKLAATSYASKTDRALLFSSLLHRGSRVGIVEGTPYVTDKLDTVDVSWVDKGLLGHGYWSDQRALITDLRSVLQGGLSPRDRGLDAIGRYWSFPK